MKLRLFCAALCVGLAISDTAHADKAAAEALFKSARSLMKKGQLAQACPEFAESQRLDPSPGTLLNLALCHKKQGKTASAWAEFLEAARMAKAQHRATVETEARKQASALDGALSHLTIHVTTKVPGLVVKRNDTPISSFGTRLPVDPGDYTITAAAPGHVQWSGKVRVGAEQESQSVTVPALQKSADVVAGSSGSAIPAESKKFALGDKRTTTPARPGEPRSDGGVVEPGSNTLGWLFTGGGIVLTGVGAVYGLMALSTYDKADRACPTHEGCSPAAMKDRNSADSLEMVSNVGIGLGLASTGVGLVLLLTGEPGATGELEATSAWRLAPYLGAEARSGGAVLGGRF